MATFGMGVASGKLHEVTDVTLAADWETASLGRHLVHYRTGKEIDDLNTDSQTTVIKNPIEKVELDSGLDEPITNISNSKHKATVEQLTDQDIIKADCSSASIVNIDSKSNCVDLEQTSNNDETMINKREGDLNSCCTDLEQTSTCDEATKNLSDLNSCYTETDQASKCDEMISTSNQLHDENAEKYLRLSEEVVSDFEKQVQNKSLSTAKEQHSFGENNETFNIIGEKHADQCEEAALERKPIVATYTRTRTSSETKGIQNDETQIKPVSDLSSRQNSSEGERSINGSRRSTRKPDSSSRERRHKRHQENNRSRQPSRKESQLENDDQINSRQEPFYRRNDEYLNDRFQSPRQPYESGATQTTLLELMTKGLGNFTEQMASLMIEKIRPEYEGLSRRVAKEVQEATVFELQELRSKVGETQKSVKDLEKEKEHLKKQLDAEKKKRVTEMEEKTAQIKTMEKELDQSKTSLKERDRVLKKAENRAKAEEQKRVKLEEDYQEQCANLKRLLDRAKGDLLVYRSKKRVALIQEKQEALASENKLSSHH